MNKLYKRITAVLLCLLLCGTGTLTFPAAAETYTGECGANGDNVIWSFNVITGTLTISGTGEMKSYALKNGSVKTPWSSFSSSIQTVLIGKGVTTIGGYAFYACTNITSVMLPDSITCISGHAFAGCGFKSIAIPNSVETIYGSAFSGCALTTITIPNSVHELGPDVFRGCRNLETVTITSSITTIPENFFINCSGLPVSKA